MENEETEESEENADENTPLTKMKPPSDTSQDDNMPNTSADTNITRCQCCNEILEKSSWCFWRFCCCCGVSHEVTCNKCNKKVCQQCISRDDDKLCLRCEMRDKLDEESLQEMEEEVLKKILESLHFNDIEQRNKDELVKIILEIRQVPEPKMLTPESSSSIISQPKSWQKPENIKKRSETSLPETSEDLAGPSGLLEKPQTSNQTDSPKVKDEIDSHNLISTISHPSQDSISGTSPTIKATTSSQADVNIHRHVEKSQEIITPTPEFPKSQTDDKEDKHLKSSPTDHPKFSNTDYGAQKTPNKGMNEIKSSPNVQQTREPSATTVQTPPLSGVLPDDKMGDTLTTDIPNDPRANKVPKTGDSPITRDAKEILENPPVLPEDTNSDIIITEEPKDPRESKVPKTENPPNITAEEGPSQGGVLPDEKKGDMEIKDISNDSKKSKISKTGDPAISRDTKEIPLHLQGLPENTTNDINMTEEFQDSREKTNRLEITSDRYVEKTSTDHHKEQWNRPEEHHQQMPVLHDVAAVAEIDDSTSYLQDVQEDTENDFTPREKIKDPRQMSIKELKAFLDIRGIPVQPGEEKSTLVRAVLRIQKEERSRSPIQHTISKVDNMMGPGTKNTEITTEPEDETALNEQDNEEPHVLVESPGTESPSAISDIKEPPPTLPSLPEGINDEIKRNPDPQVSRQTQTPETINQATKSDTKESLLYPVGLSEDTNGVGKHTLLPTVMRNEQEEHIKDGISADAEPREIQEPETVNPAANSDNNESPSDPQPLPEDKNSDINREDESNDARNMTISELKAFLVRRGIPVRPGEEKRTLVHAVLRIQQEERSKGILQHPVVGIQMIKGSRTEKPESTSESRDEMTSNSEHKQKSDFTKEDPKETSKLEAERAVCSCEESSSHAAVLQEVTNSRKEIQDPSELTNRDLKEEQSDGPALHTVSDAANKTEELEVTCEPDDEKTSTDDLLLQPEHDIHTPMSDNVASVTQVASSPVQVRVDTNSDINQRESNDPRRMTVRELKAFLQNRGIQLKPGEEKRTLLHAVITIQETERNTGKGLTKTDKHSGIRTRQTKRKDKEEQQQKEVCDETEKRVADPRNQTKEETPGLSKRIKLDEDKLNFGEMNQPPHYSGPSREIKETETHFGAATSDFHQKQGSDRLMQSSDSQMELTISTPETKTQHDVKVTTDTDIQIGEEAQTQQEPLPMDQESNPGDKPMEVDKVDMTMEHKQQEQRDLRRVASISDIESVSEIPMLSVKQLKVILQNHFVWSDGIQEKCEMVLKVEQLFADVKRRGRGDIPDEDLCRICMSNYIDCAVIECGHASTCSACGKMIGECPVCREYKVGIIRLFRVEQDPGNISDGCMICKKATINCTLLPCGHMATCYDCGWEIKFCPNCQEYIKKPLRVYKV